MHMLSASLGSQCLSTMKDGRIISRREVLSPQSRLVSGCLLLSRYSASAHGFPASQLLLVGFGNSPLLTAHTVSLTAPSILQTISFVTLHKTHKTLKSKTRERPVQK